MEFSIEIYKPTKILSANTGTELISRVEESLTVGKKHFLIDMSEALFMDSTGLGYLTRALQLVQAAEGELYLCSLKGQAAMLIDLSNLKQTVRIFQDRSDFNAWLLKQNS